MTKQMTDTCSKQISIKLYSHNQHETRHVVEKKNLNGKIIDVQKLIGVLAIKG